MRPEEATKAWTDLTERYALQAEQNNHDVGKLSDLVKMKAQQAETNAAEAWKAATYAQQAAAAQIAASHGISTAAIGVGSKDMGAMNIAQNSLSEVALVMPVHLLFQKKEKKSSPGNDFL